MAKIKVAHVITLLELGGAQGNTLYTVKHLDRARFDPVLVCGRGAILDAEAADTGAPVHFIPSLVRPVHPVKDALVFAALVRFFRRERPDVVHTHSSKAGILGRLAAAAAGVPVVIQTFHGFGFTPGQNPLVRGFFIFLEKLAAPFTDAFIAVSQANLEEAVARGIGRRDRYHLIRSGVSLNTFKGLSRSRAPLAGVPFGSEHPLVTTVGPFKPQKNLDDFLEAAALVLHARPEARFLVVGDGEGRAALEDRRKRLGLDSFVHLGGWRRDIPAVLRRTDVFAMTSLWEGLPRALVEAMAAGVPPVVNAVDGCADLVRDGENGYLVAPGRPDLTADRIVALLENRSLAEVLGGHARSSVGPEFDIDGMVRRQEALYETLVAARRK